MIRVDSQLDEVCIYFDSSRHPSVSAYEGIRRWIVVLWSTGTDANYHSPRVDENWRVIGLYRDELVVSQSPTFASAPGCLPFLLMGSVG